MKPNDLYRVLAFEQLETKRSPASLLVALAPADDDLHADSESAVQQRCVDSSAAWHHHHSAEEILRFVERQTVHGSFRPWTSPTPGDCAGADQMMKLQDDDLRAIVIAESLRHR